MKSDVYFVKVESQDLEERNIALKRLLDKVIPLLDYKKEEIVPVKITIGDSACVYNVSPDMVKTVILAIKKKGAKPFLFDTSVIYKGERQNAVDHLNLAQSKGFGYTKVGAPFIIADGLFGHDGEEFIIDSPNIKKIKTPSFVGISDNLVVLSHVSGHIVSGYAAAIKNVAMGMSCRPTKQVQHSSLKPSVIDRKCTSCGCCLRMCPAEAIFFKDGKKAFIDGSKCIGCGECICACKFDAIFINWHEDEAVFSKRMVEAAVAILSKFKGKLFINFALDITKECDCISTKDDEMIARNAGIFASFDVLSLDKATSDFIKQNRQGDFLKRKEKIYEDMFSYASRRGMGNIEYNLIEL